ncbi:MAG TPA: 5-amino-6-(D-ribitylamino)uracil--L-tyrosine 4-hydroxyphenyl transferase CofH [Hyphomicrobiaceae bacterium]|nr:5-amino-6-(D-ribitylamino)uracil--L-tyrosine 4-hydroxyphenyl transferase CofH [Hyphomicrobiaceae bacterium]
MSTALVEKLIMSLRDGDRLSGEDIPLLAGCADLPMLMGAAAELRNEGHGRLVSYSRKVFVPLTKLCRDVCHYCTFAHPPRAGERGFLTPDEVIEIARAGRAAGCQEALFTLGDKPEMRYRAAREELSALGFPTTLAYLAHVAELVFRETGLLPHLNPGIMTADEIALLRKVSVSQGIMLETISERLSQKGGPHFGSPDKVPAVRLATIAAAGEQAVPFTSGILIGIGETREERIEALLALRDLHERYGHIQEIIVQNFRAKPGTKMAAAKEPDLADHQWTIAVARLVFGAEMTIQAPPNLMPGRLDGLVRSGINDWGGVSPVTPDHVNPEAPWPTLGRLEEQTRAAGKELVQRLAIYPPYALNTARWVDPSLAAGVNDAIDASGLARTDSWRTGVANASIASLVPRHVPMNAAAAGAGSDLDQIIRRARSGLELDERQIVRLFSARGDEVGVVTSAADALRRELAGDTVTYAVNRNINYTNVCYFRCQFCAFSKGKMSENLRGRPYVLDHDEIERRAREAWERGASEVCLQGGIHPDYTGETYIEICRRLKSSLPDLHIHAFSPLEVWQGAQTTGRSLRDFLLALQDAGLSSLPGTAAEILDDEVRAIICPDKITASQWLEVMETAHSIGLRSTATIMFGHVDQPRHWARHILRVRELQSRTGGFTEFVPLPFVPHEAPIYLKGRSRPGPTFRECILMHAIARLVLSPLIPNIQTSWVKMGPDGAAACLAAGANDLGGTLMNETITRAAGAEHGQEFAPAQMEALIISIGRQPRQRTTFYSGADAGRITHSFKAAPLSEVINTPARNYVRARPGN